MKKAFAVPILLLIALIFSCYLLWPKYSEFKGLKQELNQKQIQFQQTEKYFLNLKQTSKDLENYQNSLEKIESALPSESSLSSLLNFFQKKSSETGLLLRSIGITKEEKRRKGEGILTKIGEDYLSLYLSGSYSSLKSFLKTLEKSSRLIEVENISLEQEKKELSEFNLSIKVFHE